MEKLTFNKSGQWTLSKGDVIDFSNFKRKPKQEEPKDSGNEGSIIPFSNFKDRPRKDKSEDSSWRPSPKDLAEMRDFAEKEKAKRNKSTLVEYGLKERYKPHGISYKGTDIEEKLNLLGSRPNDIRLQHDLVDNLHNEALPVQHKLLDLAASKDNGHIKGEIAKKSIHAEIQHRLADMDDIGSYSYIHRMLAANPNLHPSVKQKLGLKN